MELFSIETLYYGDGNSLQVIGNGTHMEAAERNAEVVIIEPFIWINNGKSDRLKGILKTCKRWLR